MEILLEIKDRFRLIRRRDFCSLNIFNHSYGEFPEELNAQLEKVAEIPLHLFVTSFERKALPPSWIPVFKYIKEQLGKVGKKFRLVDLSEMPFLDAVSSDDG